MNTDQPVVRLGQGDAAIEWPDLHAFTCDVCGMKHSVRAENRDRAACRLRDAGWDIAHCNRAALCEYCARDARRAAKC